MREGNPVTGCSQVVFSGAAGVGRLEGFSTDRLAHAMGMAGLIAPVMSHRSLMKSTPPNSAKYLMAGWAAQAQLTAAQLVAAGHHADVTVLDRPYGFWLYAGFSSWDPAAATAGIGTAWRFHEKTRYTVYPCCGMMRGALDCLQAIIEDHGLRPDEIERIHAYMDPTSPEPAFNNRAVRTQLDAQFSVPLQPRRARLRNGDPGLADARDQE